MRHALTTLAATAALVCASLGTTSAQTPPPSQTPPPAQTAAPAASPNANIVVEKPTYVSIVMELAVDR